MTQNGSGDQLTLFAAAILASPLALPGSDEAIKMTDTSGRKCLGLSKLSGPAGLLEKTLLATSLWASTRCYLTWKAQATPAGATLYRLSPQTPRTDETDAGLWPTPDASNRGPRSADLVVNQSTVQRRDSGQKRGIDLQTAAKLWPTPIASEAKTNKDIRPSGKSNSLTAHAGGSLNPEWVEWLMGYPVGYTDLNS